MMPAENQETTQGRLRYNEPMAAHTSLKVGGPADIFYEPADADDLAEFLQSVSADTPITWFGRGSNLLVRDGGIDGAVVATNGVFQTLEQRADRQVYVGASVPCTSLARQCVRWELGPSEFLAGIPGSLGGALAMNAGAHGHETWERVQAVTTIHRDGTIRERSPDDYTVAYRHVSGPADEWFIGATLVFDEAATASMDELKAQQDRRRRTQPLGLASCGSVFRNPPNDHAARLIEAAGLKGCRIGDAEVSDKHANFIINRGDASALDIENLIRHVGHSVADRFDIELVPEVRIIGREAA